MRYLISSFLAIALSFAAATAFPSDADVFVIDRTGIIVGIGKMVAGEVFELQLMAGFDGFAELTIVTPAGDVVVRDVVVMGGVVFLDLVDIAVMAREAGFGAVHVSAVELAADEADSGPRDAGMGNASDTGQTSAGDRPDESARVGSGNAPEDPGRPAETPDPPVVPPDPPVTPPEPPVARPEPPVEPPGPPSARPEPPVEPPGPPSARPEPPVVPPVVDPPAEPVVPPSERPVEPPVVSIDPPVDPVEGPGLPDRDTEEAEED